MKNLVLAVFLMLAPASAYAFGGGGVGVSVPDPLGGLPNGVPAIDGERVNAFWSCVFKAGCRPSELDLTQYWDGRPETAIDPATGKQVKE